MIGLLDPALFEIRSDKEVCDDLDQVLLLCRQNNIQIPPLPDYWTALWRELGEPLEKQLLPQNRKQLWEIRKWAEQSSSHFPNLQKSKVWRRGFQQLFGQTWEERMALAVVRGCLMDQEVILLTRQVVNRNIRYHQAAHSKLPECTRWLLYVQNPGMAPQRIKCIHHSRNFSVPWTIRFDWRLPSQEENGQFPFCPPDHWWKGKVQAVDTIAAKPALIDRWGNGWARPNIPGGAGYHWDLYLTSHHEQINVVGFGGPPKEGRPGNIHHIPSGKIISNRIKGWQCS